VRVSACVVSARCASSVLSSCATAVVRPLCPELVCHGCGLPDQVGVAEMKDCVLTTGGLTVQTDTFHNVVFR
jgi:hypothetical protein